jgi:hypothetical protein
MHPFFLIKVNISYIIKKEDRIPEGPGLNKSYAIAHIYTLNVLQVPRSIFLMKSFITIIFSSLVLPHYRIQIFSFKQL